MATLDDVQDAIVDVITAALYPNGSSSPSIAGVDIFIYAGDALKANLDADLVAGKIHVSVFAMKGMTRNTTNLPPIFADEQIDSATILATVNDNTITITGTITVGQAVMIIVNGTGYSYIAQQSDTTNTIATQLAALIPNASAINNVVTIAGVSDVIARISVGGTARKIIYSQESMFSVDIIAPSHELRKLTSKTIDLLFQSRYLQMPDGIFAKINRNTITEINKYELALAFERQYVYKVLYHSIDVEQFQTIASVSTNITAQTLPIS